MQCLTFVSRVELFGGELIYLTFILYTTCKMETLTFKIRLNGKMRLCNSCKFTNHFENLQHKGNYLRQMKATQFKNSNFWQQMQKYVTFEMMTNSLQLKTNTFILDFDAPYGEKRG